jgi:hypothetical protein
MGKWRKKNLSYIETISSDSEVDIPQIPLRNLMKQFRTCSFPGRTM